MNTLPSINLITGPLGSGKTTLIRHLLTLKPAHENWVLLVNEFGSVGIDGAILSEDASIHSVQLPGGCICCTAKTELQQALSEVIQAHSPDRILIEPTGLGEPDSLVDILQSDTLKNKIQLQTLFAVLDSSTVTLKELHDFTIMQNLLNMADVVILNKHDLATLEQIETLNNYCESLFPRKKAILLTQQGKIEAKWLNHTHFNEANTKPVKHNHKHQTHHHNQTSGSIGVMLPYIPVQFEQTIERLYKQELGIQSLGFIFTNQITFDWKKLYSLFDSLNKTNELQGVKRAKGVLKVGAPWMLFQWVNQQTTREYITYRRDSRLELLIESGAQFDFQYFEKQLKSCIQ